MQANVSAAKRRALVHLNVLHAHDLELQTCIATDDERIVAATRRGDALHSCAEPCDAPLTGGSGSVAPGEPDRGARAGHGGAGEEGGEGVRVGAVAEPSGGGWLEEMRARDAALQVRIARGDAAMFGVP